MVPFGRSIGGLYPEFWHPRQNPRWARLLKTGTRYNPKDGELYPTGVVCPHGRTHTPPPLACGTTGYNLPGRLRREFAPFLLLRAAAWMFYNCLAYIEAELDTRQGWKSKNFVAGLLIAWERAWVMQRAVMQRRKVASSEKTSAAPLRSLVAAGRQEHPRHKYPPRGTRKSETCSTTGISLYECLQY